MNLQTVVSGTFLGPSCVPNTGTQDSGDTAELCLREPKSAESKSSGLSLHPRGLYPC